MSNIPSPKYVLCLAVIPRYRQECVSILRQLLGADLGFYASESHLDSSVKTGIAEEHYRHLKMIRMMKKRLFIQFPVPREVLTAECTIVDLNPRSLTAWYVLLTRRATGRRTLAWGHIHPQAGPKSRSAIIRRTMRKIASGTVSYTYSDRNKAIRDIPNQPVWVAPNSLYPRKSLNEVPADGVRNNIIYVGRFERPKKVDLLVHAFAAYSQMNDNATLILVGGGHEEQELKRLVKRLGLQHSVRFEGWIDDRDTLATLYETAFCSVSSGFAGLGLTQSLGFGVPMIVADDEPHSPEIELAEQGGVSWFRSNSASSLAAKIEEAWNQRGSVPHLRMIRYIRKHYSAESMAGGLESALRGNEV